MSQNEHDQSHTQHRLWLLFVLVIVALAGNVYQYRRSERAADDLAQARQETQRQIAKLVDATSEAVQENQQRFDALMNQMQGATAATLRQAKSEVKKSSSQLSDTLEQKHQEVVTALANLKDDTNSQLGQVSTDLQQTGSDVKRVAGDLGVMGGEVATNSKDLAHLKELGERNYFEFDLTKTKDPQKIGDIRLLLRKTDPKRNRFTLSVYADDKIVEKRDRTINEPVQLYVSGNHQPYEIVVNEVKKNEVVGYLATPKVKNPRGQASGESF